MEHRIYGFLLMLIFTASSMCANIDPPYQQQSTQIDHQLKTHWYPLLYPKQRISMVEISHHNETIITWLPHNGNIVRHNEYQLVVSNVMLSLVITSINVQHYGTYCLAVHLQSYEGNSWLREPTSETCYLNLRPADVMFNEPTKSQHDDDKSVKNKHYVIVIAIAAAMTIIVFGIFIYLKHRRDKMIEDMRQRHQILYAGTPTMVYDAV